jgi:hypothetical protein
VTGSACRKIDVSARRSPGPESRSSWWPFAETVSLMGRNSGHREGQHLPTTGPSSSMEPPMRFLASLIGSFCS